MGHQYFNSDRLFITILKIVMKCAQPKIALILSIQAGGTEHLHTAVRPLPPRPRSPCTQHTGAGQELPHVTRARHGSLILT